MRVGAGVSGGVLDRGSRSGVKSAMLCQVCNLSFQLMGAHRYRRGEPA